MRTPLLIAVACAATAHADLIAYFDFEDGFNDRSLNRVPATNHGGSLVNRLNGTALSLDGVTDYVELDLDINPAAHPQLTMGAWVRAADVNRVGMVISHDDGGLDRSVGYDFRAGAGDHWTGWTGAVIDTTEPAIEGETVFLAIAFDHDAGVTRLHVNDQVFTSSSLPGTGHAVTRIGSSPFLGNYFGGLIDEVFFYDEALTPAEIAEIRQAGVVTSCNAADIAPPQDILDLADINAFITGFMNQENFADIAPPLGVFDLNDITAFLDAFMAGCP